MRFMLFLCWATVTTVALAQQNILARWDPAMAIAEAVVTNGIKWVDGRKLPLEGRAFEDVEHYYDRLPENVTAEVNPGVREMKHYTAGMQFRFATDSTALHFRWTPYETRQYMDHMPATGHSGIDVYRYDASRGEWLYVNSGRPRRVGDELVEGGELNVDWKPGEACLVNLPPYNGIRSFSLGIDERAKIDAAPAHKSGIAKPVVFYGTSVTQGGCASRPGMAFPSIVGRTLDVPIVNLGFAGSGRMEMEMAEHLARIDACCYVIDCLSNMNRCRLPKGDPCERDLRAAGITEDATEENGVKYVELRYERFLRRLRELRPDTPVVLAEACDVYCRDVTGKDRIVKLVYDKVTGEGWKNIVYLPKRGMFTGDLEGTVDGAHPNDLGMVSVAAAFSKAIAQALHL